MADQAPRGGDERGTTWIVAALLVACLSLVAGAMTSSFRHEIHRHHGSGRAERALEIAQAGVAEAAERIRSGEIGNTWHPRSVWQIFLASPRTVPALGRDSSALFSWRDHRTRLPYSTRGRSPDALTITYKTDPARTTILRFDPSRRPAVQGDSGHPIFVITSTGVFDGVRRTVVAEMVHSEVAVEPAATELAEMYRGGARRAARPEPGMLTLAWRERP